MDSTELRDRFQQATAHEPAMLLDVDTVVAGGQGRVRRRRLLATAGGAAVLALAVTVPVAVVRGGGGEQAGRARPPAVPFTAGAEHGGCVQRGGTTSPQTAFLVDWLLGKLPQYGSLDNSVTAYRIDCYDGALRDTYETGVRVPGSDGDLDVELVRANPADGVAAPCHRSPNPTSGPTPIGTPTAPGGPHFTYCVTLPRPDGSTVTIEEEAETQLRTLPFVTRVVIWWRADGTQVRVAVDNRHVLPDSRANPHQVLTRDQTVALATDPGILVFLPPQR